MPKTMVTHVQESSKATNIYLTNEVAEHLIIKMVQALRNGKTGVRISILNKDTGPDISAHPKNVG